jgi:hypothetical protein
VTTFSVQGAWRAERLASARFLRDDAKGDKPDLQRSGRRLRWSPRIDATLHFLRNVSVARAERLVKGGRS